MESNIERSFLRENSRQTGEGKKSRVAKILFYGGAILLLFLPCKERKTINVLGPSNYRRLKSLQRTAKLLLG